jgi:hypothetical protein
MNNEEEVKRPFRQFHTLDENDVDFRKNKEEYYKRLVKHNPKYNQDADINSDDNIGNPPLDNLSKTE